MEEPQLIPQILSPCISGRRKSSDSNSPEFEFWMIRNPSFPQPNLLSADQLFSDGFLLPLHLLNLSNHAPHPHEPEPSGSDRVQEQEDSTIESAELSAATPSLTSSKRWMDIFKRSDKKSSRSSKNVNGADDSCKEKDINKNGKEKKREKKNGVGASNGVSAAELNINIWPFSRSRSAGNGGTRPRSGAATRKVSSAPCSRSNSAGESKSRKWPSSPSRAGVHLGRSSPVWQVRRSGAGGGGGGGSSRSSDNFILKNAQKVVRKDGNEGRRKTPSVSAGISKPRVLSLNVPTCIGYRHHLSCRSDENNAAAVAAAAAGGVGNGDVSGEGIRGSNLFNIRSLFTKKVY